MHIPNISLNHLFSVQNRVIQHLSPIQKKIVLLAITKASLGLLVAAYIACQCIFTKQAVQNERSSK